MLPRPLSEPGPLLTYLTKLRSDAARLKAPELADRADRAQAMVRNMLLTPEGAIFLELLEVSTQLSLSPILGDDRALAARNAQGFIVADLRRIMSDETELLLQRQDDARSAGSAIARTRPGAKLRA